MSDENTKSILEQQRQRAQYMIDNLDKYTLHEVVDLRDMKTAPYCRPVSEYRVNLLLRKGFNVLAAGTMKLSLRADNEYYIIDGAHRREAAKKLGLTSLPAQVFLDLTYEQEAALFQEFARVNKMTPMDIFRARLESKDSDALDIKDRIEKIGMHVALTGPNVGGIAAIASVEKLYQDLGPAGMSTVFDILYGAWGIERRAWTYGMLDGFRLFWARYRTEVKIKDLISKLKIVTPEWILAQAGMTTSAETLGTRVGKQILIRYNKQRPGSTRLGDWKESPGNKRSFYEDSRSDITKGFRTRIEQID